MRRTIQNALFVLCLGLTLGLGSAQAQPAPYVAIDPASLLLNVTVLGAGETLAAAEANALAEIRATYFVLSYETSNPLCHQDTIITGQNQTQTVWFCSIQVDARVIRKATWVRD